MSANCNYSIKFYPLVEFQRQNLAPEDFKQWLRDNFKNADKMILQIEGGSWNGAPTSTVSTANEVIPDVARNAISTEGAEVSVDSLYLGHTDLKLQMEQKFAEDIVTRTVFDLFGTGKWIDFNENKNGISLGNFNIFNYKKQLLEALYKEMGESAPELRVDMTPQEYSGWINIGLAKYRNYLITNENAGSAFTEYAILQNFDKLIKAKAPFITFNQDLQYDAIDKYQYKGPNVEHYKGFMSSEFAAIENQDSDLAKVLLSVIPEVNESGAPVVGSFIGLSGFNSAMMTLKRALLFTNTFPKDLIDSYFNGVNIKLDKIIEKYITELRKPDNKLSDDHKSFLIGKLRGIQKFIYQSNIDNEVKDMFTQMFFKTEPIQYRAYSFSDSTQGFSGSNLKESLNNAQRYQLEDSIRGAIRLIKTTDSIKKNLKDKYNIDWQNGVITISSGDNLLTLSYKYNSHGFTFTPGGSYSQEFAEAAISDILSIVVPDTYMQVGLQLDGNNFNIMNDFAMPLGLVLLATYGKTDSIKWKSSRSSIVDLADYRTDLNKPARKLSVIYGSDTKNVVKSPSGNNLPLYQLTNLTYNINSLINDCEQKLGTTVANAYENHLFKQHPEILVAPQVRNEVMIDGQTKEPSKLSVKELLQLSTLYDFYKPFLNDGIIYLQNATFADKSTHYLIGYDTSKVIINGNITLKDALQNVIDGKSSDSIYEFTRKERNRRISRIAGNIVSDYKQVFLTETDASGRKYFQNGKYGISSNWNGQFNNLNDIDAFLQNATYNGKPITIDNLKAAFDSAGIKFQDEIHAYKPRVTSRGECRINETLLNYYNIFSNPVKWQQRVNESRKRFIASIKDNNWKWNRFDSGDMSKLWKDYQTKLSREWFDSNTGDMKLFVGDKLHPILEAYFAADMLLSNEYNSLTIGEVWAHPNKNSNDTVTSEMALSDPKLEEGTYEEFSEANRLIAQIKRSVAFGATYHPFAQSKLNGVSDEIEIAVVDDIKAYVSTPNGYEDGDLDAMDGSGLADALEARFENNSLLDARVGDNKKTIMMDVDRDYGKPILLKWAVYALTNEVRRNGWNSIASAERLCKKMRSRDIGTFQNIAQLYNERIDKIIYEDHKTGRRYKILNVGLDATNGYFREIVEVGEDGQEIGNSFPQSIVAEDPLINPNTLYALDQLFGGAWTCELSEDGWIYNEANNDMLEYILSKRENQEIKKRAFIAYTVNKSAIKVGAGNVNSNDAFVNDEPLGTITMRTRYGGVQMDADHELDMAEVTEMTQMISSLIEDGHYPEIVKQIYSDLGRVVAKHLEKYKVPVDTINNSLTSEFEKQEAREKLHQLLGESLIEAFSTGSKDTLGLAQAFLKKAAEAIKNKEEFQIPFSAATINGSFISDVVSSINRGGIRHKYEGFAGVLNPSYNMIQYYNVWNGNHFENRLYPQVAELIRKSKKDFNSVLSDKPYILTFDNGVDTQNPFVKQIYYWSELQFEDTVIVNNEGTSETIYLNTFDKLDELKERMRTNPFLVVGLHTLRPRNLRGVETRFKVGSNEYSYYDLDSVRLVFYINALSKAIKEARKHGIDAQTAFNSLSKYKQDFLRTHGISESTPTSIFQSAIRKANADTQTCLKHIEEGKAFDGLAGANGIIADSWYTRPAEIIMGRYQMKKFGFTNNDHIFNVTDASFFRDKLANKYNLPNEDSLSSELYDIILYKGNKKFYVKISNNPNEIYSKFKGISNNADFTINGDSVWYEDADITTPNGKQFKTYLNDFGETFNLISVDSIESYNELLDSGIFDQIEVMNYTDSNLDILKQIQFENNTEAELHLDRNNYWNTTEILIDNITKEQLLLDWEIRKRQLISKKADDMYDSFVQSLNIVGARIPTQAMQSFMPMHIIAFTDVDTNAVYVPAAQTALQGSDYDIDKLYIMTHSIDDNGILSIGSKLQSQLGLSIVSKLGTPTNIIYDYSDNGTIVTYDEMEGVLGNKLMSNQETIDVLKRIYNGNGFIRVDGVPITNLKKVERDKKQFLKLVNSHSQSRRDVRGNALKNRIVSAINQITLAPQNQLVAQVPINMDEPKAAARDSKLGKAELHINSDNPETKFMMQVQNMVGKEVIGISAVSLKAFFGLSYFYNQKVQNLKDAILNKGNQDILNALNELLFTNPLTGEIISLANIDIEQVYDLQFKDRFITAFLNVPPKLSEWVKINEVTGHEYFDFRKCINDIAERVNRNDSALTISAIISAATDSRRVSIKPGEFREND